MGVRVSLVAIKYYQKGQPNAEYRSNSIVSELESRSGFYYQQ